MNELKLQFSSSTAFASQMIRRLCHSEFSHVDIILPEGLLGVSGVDAELNDLGGVRIRPFAPWPYQATPKVVHLITPVAERVIEIAKGEIGKPFDDTALYAFISDSPGDRSWDAPNKWFCSELIGYCLKKADFFPYTLLSAKNRITPSDLLLMLNPFMTEDNIKEF
jgi:hypothetical protein